MSGSNPTNHVHRECGQCCPVRLRLDAPCYSLSYERRFVAPNSRNPLIWINPQRVSGAPCFYKTRLPIDSLFENLEDGVSLDEWLDAFPDITRAHAKAVLELAKQTMLASGK